MENTIVPYIEFKNYNKFIYQLRGIIGKTEKHMLTLLAKFAYKNGKCFPRQATLASKLGIHRSTVSRVIAKLVKKGFLLVNKSTHAERAAYGDSNEYLFLNHEVYGLGEADKKQACVAVHEPVKAKPIQVPSERKRTLSPLCDEVSDRIMDKLDGTDNRFKAKVFAMRYIKSYVPAAIEKTLAAIEKKLDRCYGDAVLISAMDFWGLGVKILKEIGKKENELFEIRQHERRKKEYVNINFKSLLSNIGG